MTTTIGDFTVETPELDKETEARDKGSQEIGAFLEWLGEKGYTICEFSRRGDYTPMHRTEEQWLAMYFGINLEDASYERDALIEAIRRDNDQRECIERIEVMYEPR